MKRRMTMMRTRRTRRRTKPIVIKIKIVENLLLCYGYGNKLAD